MDLFKDILHSIMVSKKDLIEKEKFTEVYNSFIIGKALSFHYDCVLQANEMNRLPATDKLLQYHYLLHSVRGYKRPFQKWHKKEVSENLEAVREYYKYSYDKAKDVLPLLSEEHINHIKSRLDRGGSKKLLKTAFN